SWLTHLAEVPAFGSEATVAPACGSLPAVRHGAYGSQLNHGRVQGPSRRRQKASLRLQNKMDSPV
ncbi:uncharacterized, partial [Tachysurus ichikawai]